MDSGTKRKVVVAILIVVLAGVVWLTLYYHRYFEYQLMIGNDYSDVQSLEIKTISGDRTIRPYRGYFNPDRKEVQLVFTIPKSMHDIPLRQIKISIDGSAPKIFGTCHHSSLFMRQESIILYELESFKNIRFECEDWIFEFYRE